MQNPSTSFQGRPGAGEEAVSGMIGTTVSRYRIVAKQAAMQAAGFQPPAPGR